MAKKEKKVKAGDAGGAEKAAGGAEQAADGGKKAVGGFLFVLISLFSALLVICAVVAGFLFFIVRANAFGVSDTYRDAIEKVPVLKIALPARDTNDPNEMTKEELAARYAMLLTDYDKLQNEIDGAYRQIDELSQAKSEFDAQALINDEKTAQLEQRLATFEAQKKQLEDMKYDLERAAASGDKEAFAKYYETVSPEVAQEIYAQVLQQEKNDGEKKRFIKLFQTMDTKTSAQIIETLGASRIDFIAETLDAVKRDITAEIIGQLSPDLAAQVTLRLSGN